MAYDIQQALNEIMELPPIYRREVIIDYLRKNLPEDDARRHLFRKTGTVALSKMIEHGYIRQEKVLEKIGVEKVKDYFYETNTAV